VIRLKLASRPLGLAVHVDGHPIDPSDLAAPREVDPGMHVVEATAPGHRAFRWEQSLADGQTADVAVTLEAEPADARIRKKGTPPWMFYTAGGSAVAAIGAASILAVHANDRSNDEQRKNPFARAPSEKDAIRTEATVANVLFITGAVLGAGAVVLAFTTDWKKDATAPRPPQEPRSRAQRSGSGLTVRSIGVLPGFYAEGSF
jgi:hypothetical protein